MTEKRRPDEQQSRPSNGGASSNAGPRAQINRYGSLHNSGGRFHRPDARRAALWQRGRHPRQRSCADDRLSDHRGRERLARRRRRAGHAGSRARDRCGDRLRPRAGVGRPQLPGARARPLERGETRRPGDRRGRRRDKAGAGDDRRQAGIRRLLGIFPRRGDLHLARPSVLGRRRRDRPRRQADRRRLVACRAAELAARARATST